MKDNSLGRIPQAEPGSREPDPQAVPAAVAASIPCAWPSALTPELRSILGMMCFQLGSIAHVYRDAGLFVGADGEQLKSRAEDEQAFMLHRLIGLWIKHGEDWAEAAQAELNQIRNERAASAIEARRAATAQEGSDAE